MNKKLNTISLIIYLTTMLFGLLLCIISIHSPGWFTFGFVVFVIGMFLFFIAYESRGKMNWRDEE